MEWCIPGVLGYTVIPGVLGYPAIPGVLYFLFFGLLLRFCGNCILMGKGVMAFWIGEISAGHRKGDFFLFSLFGLYLWVRGGITVAVELIHDINVFLGCHMRSLTMA